MPIYEYKCESCNKTFEALRGITERDQKEKCPLCGKPASRKKFSVFGTCSSNSSCSTSKFT